MTAAIAELAAPGEEVVVGDDVYGGTFRYLERVRRGDGVDARYVDLAAGPDVAVGGADGADPAGLVRDAVRTRTSRSSTSRRRSRSSRGARPRAAVGRWSSSTTRSRHRRSSDRCWSGADIVFHSATKYLAGHSDTILGVAVTSDEAVAERLRFLQNAMGAVPGPLDCFLVLRGLRTLHLRMERHGANAAARRRVPPRAAGRRDRPLPGVRRDGLVRAGRRRRHGSARPRNGRSRSPRGRGSSPSPSRSVASSRSSRSRRR